MQLQRQTPQQRDERPTFLGHDPRGHDTRASDLPDPRNVTLRQPSFRDERSIEAPAPELRRVAKTKNAKSKAPGGHGMPAIFRAGKILSSDHYDFEDLRSQGVELVPVDQEIVPVQMRTEGGASLGSIVEELAKVGMRVVPAESGPSQMAAPASDPSEVEQLKVANATMQAQLAEMQKTLSELTSAKKKG